MLKLTIRPPVNRMELPSSSKDLNKPASTLLLTLTTPAAVVALHASLTAGQAVRSYGAVHFKGPSPSFSNIKSVPAAVPPPPNAGGVRGGRASYAAQQGLDEFVFDYGLAFQLRQTEAFAQSGFGTACMGSTCLGKNPIYARGQEPFIWERKRNRGGAVICPGAGGHLLCLRRVEAEYVGGRPFVSKKTERAIPQGELFAKFELYPERKDLHQAQSREAAMEGGHQFFVQRRDLALCPYCTEPKAISKQGVKRGLEEGPAPSELGPMAMLAELARSKIPSMAIAPGLFLVLHWAQSGTFWTF